MNYLNRRGVHMWCHIQSFMLMIMLIIVNDLCCIQRFMLLIIVNDPCRFQSFIVNDLFPHFKEFIEEEKDRACEWMASLK